MKQIFVVVIILFASISSIAQDKYFKISKNSDIYNAIWRELDINYVDTINHDKLNLAAINYMLNALDPYTVYISEEDQEALKQMTTGEYGGIGTVISQHDDGVVISGLSFGMPAQRNGFLVGDIILKIDGESIKGKPTSYISENLRGIPGTEITLTVQRPGVKKPIEKKFTRELIQSKAIDYYGIVSDSIAYIVLSEFTDKAYADFKHAMAEMTATHQVKSLIIDLRNNSGGLVKEAVNIASLFLPKHSLVTKMQGRSEASSKTYKTTMDPLYPTIPIAVLVNEYSASAAELLAGALQDLDRGVIVGERTFGKGLVQSILQLPYDGYLKITTAKYYIPSGRCIQAIDYAQRLEGQQRNIPDSLTSEFKTANGRIVRDGCGILPDIQLKPSEDVNISYYLYMKNLFFDFATDYYQANASIAPANSFSLSDEEYVNFTKFVMDKEFSYRLESEKYLQDLKEIVAIEGYAARTDSLFTQLTEQLQPNVERDLKEFKKDVLFYLEQEIIKRYYYGNGIIEYQLRNDQWLERAIQVLATPEEYQTILKGS